MPDDMWPTAAPAQPATCPEPDKWQQKLSDCGQDHAERLRV